jgi:hypothetical protein
MLFIIPDSMSITMPYSELNRLSYNHPIYVGKAVPSGWRQARTSDTGSLLSRELQRRLREHTKCPSRKFMRDCRVF